MRPNSPSAFFLSALLHGIFVALALLMAYLAKQNTHESPTVFELVGGEGDNYMATEAPALGTPGGIKLKIPDMPAPPTAEPAPLTPVRPAPVIERAPIVERPVTPVQKAPDSIPDFNKLVKHKAAITQIRKEANDRRAREIAARKEREAAAKAAKEEALKKNRLTKAEFDKLNKSKSSPTKSGTHVPKIAKIDVVGIAKGMVGGSPDNKVGGANGPALTRSEGDAIDGYAALLARKIKLELDERPGVGAGMIVEIEVRIMADGTLTGFRIIRSSGSAEFDQAVREAFAIIDMPPRPKGLTELQRIPIRGVE